MYRVKAEILDLYPQLFTQVNGKTVTLHGKEEKKVVEATARNPRREIMVPVATQTDLKILFDQKHPFIEQYEKEKV